MHMIEEFQPNPLAAAEAAQRQKEHDHKRARGGFWVLADGSSVPVLDPQGHRDTFEKRGMASYSECYDHGWVHITYCLSDAFAMTLGPNSTVAAVRSALRIAEHNEREGLRQRWEVDYSGGYPEKPDHRGRKVAFGQCYHFKEFARTLRSLITRMQAYDRAQVDQVAA